MAAGAPVQMPSPVFQVGTQIRARLKSRPEPGASRETETSVATQLSSSSHPDTECSESLLRPKENLQCL